MKKVFITGVAGTGKTTICRELHKREIQAFDIGTLSGMCYWRNKETKQSVEYSPGVSQVWLETNERVCDVERLREFLKGQSSKVVITGIVGGNQEEILPLFDKIILLQCKPEDIVHRLEERTTSDFGKNSSEQEAVLKQQKSFDKSMIAQGAIPIDTTGSVAETVRKVLKEL